MMLLPVAFTLASCAGKSEWTVSSSDTSSSQTESGSPQDLRDDSSLGHQLTDQQKRQISVLQKTFAEVDNQSLEQWIDNFKRDANPDLELAIWDRVAKAYKGYCSKHPLDLASKKEVFKVLLLRSMTSQEDVLKRIELKAISKNDAIQIMEDY